mgnify:CR=1 FL=1
MAATLALLSALHVIAAVIWVGGMFFAYVCLRPAAGVLAPPDRLALWRGTLRRFLHIAGGAAAVLLVSGYALGGLLYGGLAGFPAFVHVMHALAWLMSALFALVYFGPFRRLAQALDREDTPAAAAALDGVRKVVAGNLVLGLLLILSASAGRFLGV